MLIICPLIVYIYAKKLTLNTLTQYIYYTARSMFYFINTLLLIDKRFAVYVCMNILYIYFFKYNSTLHSKII